MWSNMLSGEISGATNALFYWNQAWFVRAIAFRFRRYRTAFTAPVHLRNPDEAVAWYFVDWLTAYSRGFEICRMLRDSKPSKATYITMVFDPIDEDIENKRRALQAGADGYLVAPVTLGKIEHRLTLRSGPPTIGDDADLLRCGPLVLDSSSLSARYNGDLMGISTFEFRLFALLMQKHGEVISRKDLIRLCGKNLEKIDEKTVPVWIGRIRKALKHCGAPNYIRTIISAGYT